MAVSRPFLLALLATLLAAATFFAFSAARDGNDEGASDGGTAVVADPPAKSPAPAKKAPEPAAKPDAAANAPKPAAPVKSGAAPARQAEEAGVPATLERALQAKRTVVLFFFQRGAADDAGTAAAVASLGKRAGVSVFRAPIERLADFRAVTGAVGVTQAPSVVIISKGRSRIVEGYVDSATLAQELRDAR